MILTRSAIRHAIGRGDIAISPFDERALSVNSYDVTLSPYISTYKSKMLDCALDNDVETVSIGENGLLLEPYRLYLACTNEYTESHAHVPKLEGKSSLGRLGLAVHVTAGMGDVGFCGNWTLEIWALQPIVIYAGMPIAQLCWYAIEGECESYAREAASKYAGKPCAVPQRSKMHLNECFN